MIPPTNRIDTRNIRKPRSHNPISVVIIPASMNKAKTIIARATLRSLPLRARLPLVHKNIPTAINIRLEPIVSANICIPDKFAN